MDKMTEIQNIPETGTLVYESWVCASSVIRSNRQMNDDDDDET